MAKPYTVGFGPWTPDLQNVGIQMPLQWTETELPVADCLNVYWQDGTYRSIPSPSSIGPSLGTQIQSAFTWYDQTQGKEIVFGATANGFWQLVDGAWVAIPFTTGINALGLAIALAMGSPISLAFAITPTSESQTSGASSFVFPTVSAVIGYGSATYNWTFSGTSGPGTWSIQSGQGTANAIPQVTGANTSAASSTNFNCTIVSSGITYNVSAPLTYTQSGPVQFTFSSGSGTVTVPAGYTTLVIESWGGGGGGGAGTTGFEGSGGGGGGYCRSQYTCSSGQTVNYSVGAAGSGGIVSGSAATAGTATSVTSGTLSITTMTAGGGGLGGTGGSGVGGSGGTASGGNQANTAGGAGGTRDTFAGTTTNGVYANNPAVFGPGGVGGFDNADVGHPTNGFVGNNGYVSFYFS